MRQQMALPAFSLLDESNWSVWSIRIADALRLRGLPAQPKANLATDDEKEQDQQALALIRSCVQDHFLALIATEKTAAGALKKLKELASSKIAARLYGLCRELSSIQQQSNESMLQYSSRVTGLCQALEDGGVSIPELLQVTFLLNGLGSAFTAFTQVLVAGSASLSMDAVVPKLVAEDMKQQQEVDRDAHPSAMTAVHRSSKQHNNRPWCSECKKHGHSEARCWKLHPELRPKKSGHGSDGHVAQAAAHFAL